MTAFSFSKWLGLVALPSALIIFGGPADKSAALVIVSKAEGLDINNAKKVRVLDLPVKEYVTSPRDYSRASVLRYWQRSSNGKSLTSGLSGVDKRLDVILRQMVNPGCVNHCRAVCKFISNISKKCRGPSQILDLKVDFEMERVYFASWIVEHRYPLEGLIKTERFDNKVDERSLEVELSDSHFPQPISGIAKGPSKPSDDAGRNGRDRSATVSQELAYRSERERNDIIWGAIFCGSVVIFVAMVINRWCGRPDYDDNQCQ